MAWDAMVVDGMNCGWGRWRIFQGKPRVDSHGAHRGSLLWGLLASCVPRAAVGTVRHELFLEQNREDHHPYDPYDPQCPWALDQMPVF